MQLLGFHVADAGVRSTDTNVSRDFFPVALDFLLDVDFVDGEPLV